MADTKNPISQTLTVSESLAQQKALQSQQKTHVEIIASLKEEIELEKQRLKILTDNQEKTITQNNIVEKQIEIGERVLNSEEEILKNRLSQEQAAQRNGKISKEMLEQREKLLQIELLELKNKQKEFDKEKEILKLRKEGLHAIESSKDATKSLLLNLTGISSEWKEGFFGKAISSLNVQGGFTSFLKNVGKGVKETLTPMNMFVTSIEKIQEATAELLREQEEAMGAFNRSTGAAGEYNKMIDNLGHSNLELGIESKDVAQAIQGLRENFAGFTSLTKQAQAETVVFSATMEKLGVDSNTTGKSFNILTKSLGLSSINAMKAQRELLATSKALQIAPAKAVADFQAAAPRLAAFGDQMIQKFKELQVASKATGIEISELLNWSEQFDTFEGAATSVGKLNAILGGPLLNAMDMVYMDDLQRQEAVRQAVNNSGKAFESMGKHSRKAITAAMGMKDVAQASAFLSGKTEELSDAAKAEALSQEEMNKMAKESMTLFNQLKMIAMSFAQSLQFVIEPLKGALTWFLEFKKANSWVGTLALSILGVVAAFKAFLMIRKAHKALGPVLGMFGLGGGLDKGLKGIEKAKGPIDAITKSQGSLGDTISDVGKKAKPVIGTILAVGAAILMIGAGIFLVLYGLTQLANSIKGMTSEEMKTLEIVMGAVLLAIVGLAIALPFLAATATAGAIGLIVLGLSILMIGGAITLVLWGVSKVIEAIGKIVQSFANVLTGMSAAMSSMKDLIALVWSIGIVNIVNLASSIGILASSFVELAKAMSMVPEGKTIVLRNLIETTTLATEDKVENVKRLVDQAERYRSTQNEVKAGTMDQFTNMIAESNKTLSSSNKGMSERQPIILELDGRVLKRFVIDILNDKGNPRKI